MKKANNVTKKLQNITYMEKVKFKNSKRNMAQWKNLCPIVRILIF